MRSEACSSVLLVFVEVGESCCASLGSSESTVVLESGVDLVKATVGSLPSVRRQAQTTLGGRGTQHGTESNVALATSTSSAVAPEPPYLLAAGSGAADEARLKPMLVAGSSQKVHMRASHLSEVEVEDEDEAPVCNRARLSSTDIDETYGDTTRGARISRRSSLTPSLDQNDQVVATPQRSISILTKNSPSESHSGSTSAYDGNNRGRLRPWRDTRTV